MTNKTQWFLLTALAGWLLASGCATITGFQTGRTVGEDAGEVSLSLNFANAANFDTDDGNNNEDEILQSATLGFLELGGRYGVSEKVDIGLRLNTTLNFLTDVKVQVVGDQFSPFAMSLGAGFGGFGFISGGGMLLNFQVPVYTSYHPSDNFAVYLSPRYIGQFATALNETSGLLNYYGANAGFEVGGKTRFGFDVGYYGLSGADSEVSSNIFQLGLGMKFRFGGE